MKKILFVLVVLFTIAISGCDFVDQLPVDLPGIVDETPDDDPVEQEEPADEEEPDEQETPVIVDFTYQAQDDFYETVDASKYQLHFDEEDYFVGDQVTGTIEILDPWLAMEALYDEGHRISNDLSFSFNATKDTYAFTILFHRLEKATLSLLSNVDALEGVSENHPVGSVVTIQAEPLEGYVFDYFLDIDFNVPLSLDETFSFELLRDRNIEAIYRSSDEAGLFVYDNLDQLDYTVNGFYPLGDTVSLEASIDAQFVHWLDYYNDEILSSSRQFDLTLNETLHVVAIYAVDDEVQTTVETGFEDTTKGTYASGEIVSGDGRFYLEDALIGRLDNDIKDGLQSVRLREGALTLLDGIEDFYKLTFYYASYGADSDSELYVYLSNDLEHFEQVKALNTESSLVKAQVHIDDLIDLASINFDEPVYIKISSPSTNRVNIDDFKVESKGVIINDHPLKVFETDVIFPNNSERITLDLSNLNLYYSYLDDVTYEGCEAFDTVLEIYLDCEVYGSVNTSTLGAYDVTFYVIDEDGFYASETVTKVVFKDHTLLDYTYSSYYTGIEGLYGEALIEALRAIITSDVYIPTYADAREHLEYVDQDPDALDNVLLIYNRDSVPGLWDATTWHREHVWPNSRLGIERVQNHQRNIGSDLHNLRAINPSVNSSRSNLVFNYEGEDIGYYPGEDQGDVARIYFYMMVMYEHLVLSNTLTEADTYTVEGAEHGLLDVLIDFHYSDEVDAFEHQRNERIYSIQNNKNPFIDYPHLLELIYFDHLNIPLD